MTPTDKLLKLLGVRCVIGTGTTSDNWYYVKWSDGFMEAWRTSTTASYAVTTKTGEVYISQSLVKIQPPTDMTQVLFNNIFIKEVKYPSAPTQKYSAWIAQSEGNTFYLVRQTSATIQVTFDYYATGYWK